MLFLSVSWCNCCASRCSGPNDGQGRVPVVHFGQCRHGFLQMDEYVVHYSENCGVVFGARWKQVYICQHLELRGPTNSHYDLPGYTAFVNQLL